MVGHIKPTGIHTNGFKYNYKLYNVRFFRMYISKANLRKQIRTLVNSNIVIMECIYNATIHGRKEFSFRNVDGNQNADLIRHALGYGTE